MFSIGLVPFDFIYNIMTSNGNIFHVIGPLRGELTGHRWIRLTKASDALMFSLIYAGTNSWVNNWVAGDLRHHRAHHYVTVMIDFTV